MKIFINTTSWTIQKIENEYPALVGDNYIDTIKVLYDVNPETALIYPTLSVLKPNGRKIGAISFDTADPSYPHEYEDADSNTWYLYEFTLSSVDGILSEKGTLQCTITTNKYNSTNNTITAQKNVFFQLNVLNAVTNDNNNILILGDSPDVVVAEMYALLQTLNTSVANLSNGKVDKADIGYFELTPAASGTLTEDQLYQSSKNHCVIKITANGVVTYLYKFRATTSNSAFNFRSIPTLSNNLGIDTFNTETLTVTASTGAYTYASSGEILYSKAKTDELLALKVAYADIVDNLTTNDATKPLSAKQGKVLNDTKFDKANIGYIEVSSYEGTLTAEQLLEVNKMYCVIKYTDSDNEEYYYYKCEVTDYAAIFIGENSYAGDGNGTLTLKQNLMFVILDSGEYNETAYEAQTYTKTKINSLLLNESNARSNADNNLQSQIDGLNAGQNLADIVADLTALNNLSVTNLKSGDKVQVLVDSNHDNASTVYSLTISGNSHSWSYIGKYGQDGYTKAEENALLATKQDVIDATHKLSSDLVDDTGHTNKFVTAEEKAQITTNANAIAGIKDGTDIDSFGDVESALSGKQDTLSGSTSIDITSNVVSVNQDYIDSQFLTDAEMTTLLSEVFD